jgi:hypothetical protein
MYEDGKIREIRTVENTAQFARAMIDVGESFGLSVFNSEHELQQAAALRDGGLTSLYEDGKCDQITAIKMIYQPLRRTSLERVRI